MLSGYHERHLKTTAMTSVQVSCAKYSGKCKVSKRSGLINLYSYHYMGRSRGCEWGGQLSTMNVYLKIYLLVLQVVSTILNYSTTIFGKKGFQVQSQEGKFANFLWRVCHQTPYQEYAWLVESASYTLCMQARPMLCQLQSPPL